MRRAQRDSQASELDTCSLQHFPIGKDACGRPSLSNNVYGFLLNTSLRACWARWFSFGNPIVIRTHVA